MTTGSLIERTSPGVLMAGAFAAGTVVALAMFAAAVSIVSRCL